MNYRIRLTDSFVGQSSKHLCYPCSGYAEVSGQISLGLDAIGADYRQPIPINAYALSVWTGEF